jgi:hypothetical protein
MHACMHACFLSSDVCPTCSNPLPCFPQPHPKTCLNHAVYALLLSCSNEALHVAEHDLQLFLKALHNELDTVSLHPDPTRMVGASTAGPNRMQHKCVPPPDRAVGQVAGVQQAEPTAQAGISEAGGEEGAASSKWSYKSSGQCAAATCWLRATTSTTISSHSIWFAAAVVHCVPRCKTRLLRVAALCRAVSCCAVLWLTVTSCCMPCCAVPCHAVLCCAADTG